MSRQQTQRYDRAMTVFSPDGQLLQVQYAHEAVKKGSAVVGVRGPEAIVLACEKRVVPRLQIERTEKKIWELDRQVGLAFSGLRADARVVISRARIECQSYKLIVEDAVTVEYITKYIANLKQSYTQGNGRRPFGLGCLIGGFDPDGTPHLFQTEPSGVYHEWKACSTGRCEKITREFLEKNYSDTAVATVDATAQLAMKAILVVAHPMNIDMVIVKKMDSVTHLDDASINTILLDIEEHQSEASDSDN